jgi:hypothetical protein
MQIEFGRPQRPPNAKRKTEETPAFLLGCSFRDLWRAPWNSTWDRLGIVLTGPRWPLGQLSEPRRDIGTSRVRASRQFSFLHVAEPSGKCCIQELGDTLSLLSDPESGRKVVSTTVAKCLCLLGMAGQPSF